MSVKPTGKYWIILCVKMTVRILAVALPFAASLAATDFTNMPFAQICRAAQGGDKDAQFYLGGMYEMGIEVRKDDTQAKYWYKKAAQQGHLGAWVLAADKTIPHPKSPSETAQDIFRHRLRFSVWKRIRNRR